MVKNVSKFENRFGSTPIRGFIIEMPEYGKSESVTVGLLWSLYLLQNIKECYQSKKMCAGSKCLQKRKKA